MAPRPQRTDRATRPEAGEASAAQVRLLETAASLFADRGYAQATTRELAERLGIQKASLYHHISSKDQLLLEISLESLRRIHAAVQAVAISAAPVERLERVIETHVDRALADQDMHTVMLTELRSLSGVARAEVVASRDRYEALIRDVVAVAQTAGVVRRDVTSRHLTLLLLNLVNWTIFWYHPGEELDPPRLGRMIAAVFLEGAGT